VIVEDRGGGRGLFPSTFAESFDIETARNAAPRRHRNYRGQRRSRGARFRGDWVDSLASGGAIDTNLTPEELGDRLNEMFRAAE